MVVVKRRVSIVKRIYENWEVYHPNGKLMFHGNEKRAKWYLNRGIAFQFKEKAIQLLFMPKNDGEPSHLLIGRENICVVCGTDKELTKHHVVPAQYRKNLPHSYKDRNFVDILPLCRTCHDKYEREADNVKDEWENRWSVGVNEWNVQLNKAQSYYRTYLDRKDLLPDNRLEELTDKIIKWCLELGVELDDLLETEKKDISKIIVDKWTPECLIKFWKKHFLEKANPKFMPENWDPNYVKIVNK